MSKINKGSNRFEQLLLKYSKYFRFFDYFVKLVGIIVILLALLEFSSGLVVKLYSHIDERNNADIFKNAEWARDYFKEFGQSFRSEYFPYVGFRRIPNYSGKYINLDENSLRKTYFDCRGTGTDTVKIFVFGGSTVWGTGARDEGTIPSFISKEMCSRKFHVEVINYGESGYVNTQEMIRFLLELKRGNIPDIAIFYDGVNDAFVPYQGGTPGAPENMENRKREYMAKDKFYAFFPNFNRVFQQIMKRFYDLNFIKTPIDSNLDTKTKDVYLNNITLIKALEGKYRFKTFFYWQPAVFTKKQLSKFEKTISVNPTFRDIYLDITKEIDKSAAVKNLSNVFENEAGTVFIDPWHVSEAGNEIIAKKIAPDIEKYLTER